MSSSAAAIHTLTMKIKSHQKDNPIFFLACFGSSYIPEKAHVSSYRYIWLPGLSLFCPYLGVRQFVVEAGSTFGRFHPHLYSTFPLIFFQPPLCWLMPQYHRSDPHFPAIIRPFTLHHEILSVLTSLLHFFTVYIVMVDPFIYPSGKHTCCKHAIYYGHMDHPHNTQGVVN